MPLILAVILYGGAFVGYAANDQIVQPYIQQQIEQQKKDWPVDQLGVAIEQESELAFEELK
jgi:hypothetical protein